MSYILEPTRARRGPERHVAMRNFPWMSRVTLLPYGDSRASKTRADRLNPHVHHSHNIHRIVAGELTITLMLNETAVDPNAPKMTITARTRRTEDKEIIVEPGQWYRGEPGPEGCIFIEGHRMLSPTTEKRFCERGDIFKKP